MFVHVHVAVAVPVVVCLLVVSVIAYDATHSYICCC